MNKKYSLLSCMAILVMAVFACSPASKQTEQPQPLPVTVIVEPTPTAANQMPRTEAEVPRVSLEETVKAIQGGEAVIVDVRSPQAYQVSHIPGALSIPLGEIETNPDGLSLDKNQWIITYCT